MSIKLNWYHSWPFNHSMYVYTYNFHFQLHAINRFMCKRGYLLCIWISPNLKCPRSPRSKFVLICYDVIKCKSVLQWTVLWPIRPYQLLLSKTTYGRRHFYTILHFHGWHNYNRHDCEWKQLWRKMRCPCWKQWTLNSASC